MASYKIYYKAATKHVKVLRATDTAPGNGFTTDAANNFNYVDGDSYLPYHYVRDMMYKLGNLDMSKIIIDTVDEIANVTGISISPSTAALAPLGTQQLTVTFTPTTPDNTAMTYVSSDEEIATVDAEGLITAVADGEATITGTSTDGSFTDTCVVTVLTP